MVRYLGVTYIGDKQEDGTHELEKERDQEKDGQNCNIAEKNYNAAK